VAFSDWMPEEARFMSAGTRVACAFGGPHGLLRARGLDSVGVGDASTGGATSSLHENRSNLVAGSLLYRRIAPHSKIGGLAIQIKGRPTRLACPFLDKNQNEPATVAEDRFPPSAVVDGHSVRSPWLGEIIGRRPVKSCRA
jgi:hypothetical protein